MKNPYKTFRFTLIEIIIVIAIISILAGLTLYSVNMSQRKAKYTRWLGYNTMLNKDSDTVLNYNFTNMEYTAEYGGKKMPALYNGALACGVEGASPADYNGIINKATWVKKGGRTKNHNALSFDGKNSYVEIPGVKALDLNPLTDDFTALTWVRFDSVSSTRVLFGKADWPNTSQYDLYLNVGYMECDIGLISPTYKSVKIVAGQWYHLALVSDKGNGRLFLNGKEIPKDAKSGTASKYAMTPAKLLLGGIYSNNMKNIRYFFSGRMDEFVFLRKTLKDSEIRNHYEMGLNN